MFSNTTALGEGMLIVRWSISMWFQIMLAFRSGLAFCAWLTAPSLRRTRPFREPGGGGCPHPPCPGAVEVATSREACCIPWGGTRPGSTVPPALRAERSNRPQGVWKIPLRSSPKSSRSSWSWGQESAQKHEQAWSSTSCPLCDPTLKLYRMPLGVVLVCVMWCALPWITCSKGIKIRFFFFPP